MLSEQTSVPVAFEEVRQLPKNNFETASNSSLERFDELLEERRETQLGVDLETVAFSNDEINRGEDSLEIPALLIPVSCLEAIDLGVRSENCVIKISEQELIAHNSPLIDTVTNADYGVELLVTISILEDGSRKPDKVRLIRFEREKRLDYLEKEGDSWNPSLFLQTNNEVDFVQESIEYLGTETIVQPYHSLERIGSVEVGTPQQNFHVVRLPRLTSSDYQYFLFSTIYTKTESGSVEVETGMRETDLQEIAKFSTDAKISFSFSDHEGNAVNADESTVGSGTLHAEVDKAAQEAIPNAITMTWGGTFRIVYPNGEAVLQEKIGENTFKDVEKHPEHEHAYLKTLAIYEELLEAFARGEYKEISSHTINAQPDGKFYISTTKYSVNELGEIISEGECELVDEEGARKFKEENPEALFNMAEGSIIELLEADEESEFLYNFDLVGLKPDEGGKGSELLSREVLISKLKEWIEAAPVSNSEARPVPPFVFHGKDGEELLPEVALEFLLKKHEELLVQYDGGDDEAVVISQAKVVPPKIARTDLVNADDTYEDSNSSIHTASELVTNKKIVSSEKVSFKTSEVRDSGESKKYFTMLPIEYSRKLPEVSVISSRFVRLPPLREENSSPDLLSKVQDTPNNVLEVRTLISHDKKTEDHKDEDRYLTIFKKEIQPIISNDPVYTKPPTSITEEITVPLVHSVNKPAIETIEVLHRVKVPESKKDSQIVTTHIHLDDLVAVQPKKSNPTELPDPPSLWLALDSSETTAINYGESIPLTVLGSVTVQSLESEQEVFSSMTELVSTEVKEVEANMSPAVVSREEMSQEVGMGERSQETMREVEGMQTVSKSVSQEVTSTKQYASSKIQAERSVQEIFSKKAEKQTVVSTPRATSSLPSARPVVANSVAQQVQTQPQVQVATITPLRVPARKSISQQSSVLTQVVDESVVRRDTSIIVGIHNLPGYLHKEAQQLALQMTSSNRYPLRIERDNTGFYICSERQRNLIGKSLVSVRN